MKVTTRFTALCLMLAIILVSVSVAAVKSGGNDDGAVIDGLQGMAAVEIKSNRHTQAETLSAQVNNYLTLDGFEKKMENDNLAIWFNSDIEGIRIVDKRNGYIWGSLEQLDPDDMTEKWIDMGNSICTIEYYSSNNAEKKISVADRSVRNTYNWENDSMTCDVNFTKLGISFKIEFNLYPDGFDIAMVKGSLTEIDEYKIKSLYFLPFLGCSREDITDGYIFIPDGSGALMRFTKESSYVTGFEGKVYGLDMGIDTLASVNDLMSNRTSDYLVDAPQVTLPVFGIVHGTKRNGFLGIIEDGEEHAKIVASPSGVVTKYFWSTACFDFRQIYIHVTGGSSQGIYEPQEKPDDVTPKVRYYFLQGDNADYSGMAVTYREYLKEKGYLKTERKDKSMPLKLDLVGAEVKEGVFFNTTKGFTTVSEAGEIVDTLKKDGIENLTLVFDGWQKKGISASDFAETAFEKKVGSRGAMEDLRDKVQKNGGRFYLECNPITGNQDQLNLSREVVMSKSNILAKLTRSNDGAMYPDKYFVKVKVLDDALAKYLKKLTDFSLSFKDLGYAIYADNTRNQECTRKETMNMVVKHLKKAKNDIALTQVNQFLLPYIDDYFETPTTGSQCLFETDSVPFLQIVLKGSVDYYANYANQGFYSQNSILKMIEYGCYPSFIVAAADNIDITDTPLEDYFSLNFNDWRPTIKDVYSQVSSVLNETEGQTISNHTMVANGVAKVTYSGGTTVYVNYTEIPYTEQNITVPAQGYTVERS